ncbi:MAG TPA: hypothetical protein VHT24_11640 [Pseudacidobacterium sp.]|jgi:hypothetical protein|nr:hypothetical protein [Pseudacidobacterium sp.]
MSVFNGKVHTPLRVPDPGTDHLLPPSEDLSYGAITSSSALAGTNGVDAALIHGNQWLELYGNLTDDIHGNFNCNIFRNHRHKTIGDYDCTIVGKTTDKRIGCQLHTNVAPRVDIYLHTRCESHSQPENRQQPTSRKDWFSNLIQYVDNHIERKTWMLTIIGAAVNVYGAYVRLTGTQLQSAELEFKRKDVAVKGQAIKTEFSALKTDIKGLKLKAAGAHLKAIAGNICAGVAFNMDSPWA